MARNDVRDFLYFITHNKNMSHNQMIVRDRLLFNEIEKGTIAVLKNELKNKDKQDSQKEQEPLSPYVTASFLAQFNDPLKFKYLTHDFDDITDKSRPNTAKAIKIQVDKCLKDVKQVPISLISLMRAFVDGSGPWLDYNGNKHNRNWAMKTWQEWSKDHPNAPHPIHNKDMANEIETFRGTIRLVSPKLQTWIDEIRNNYDLNISTTNLNTADFYTNTFQLMCAIKKILKMMNDRATLFPDVKIEYENYIIIEKNMIIHKLYITQKDSFSDNNFEDVLFLHKKTGKGELGGIRSSLNGYCHWAIISKWNGVQIKWNYLKDEKELEYERIEDKDVTGFTHILTFYTII